MAEVLLSIHRCKSRPNLFFGLAIQRIAMLQSLQFDAFLIPNQWVRILVMVSIICNAYLEGSELESDDKVEILESMDVIDITPTYRVGIDPRDVPSPILRITEAELKWSLGLDLTDVMNRALGSFLINDAQGNPLQPNFQFRGFTSSPILGLPQGLAVFQNGVRMNEPFGDTVNWDLIPLVGISSVNVMAGSNPMFGLNTLGGAISIRTKNGFSHPGNNIKLYGGSFGRLSAQFESGANKGDLGYYIAAHHFQEVGWRDFSDSEASNLLGVFSWRDESSSLNLNFSAGKTELRGNGASPIELLENDRSAVFTHPDITKNALSMFSAEWDRAVGKDFHFSGTAYFRSTDTDSFNGDGSEFEECIGNPGHEYLCDRMSSSGEVPILDQVGGFANAGFDAINNISRRDQVVYGGLFQIALAKEVGTNKNQFIFGGSFDRGESRFESQVELSQLTDDRGTVRTGVFVPEEEVEVKTRTETWSLYFWDTVYFSEEMNVSVSGRYNNSDIRIRDITGVTPDLNGDHHFDRFNFSAGITHDIYSDMGFYFNFSQSNRVPTPVELACANPDAPCNLPNSFLADPPLEQVRTNTLEGGFRGQIGGSVELDVGIFRSENEDDIIFISTGGVTSNRGFFDNIGNTRRQGIEFRLRGDLESIQWHFNYSYLRAEFNSGFVSNSPHHPNSSARGDIDVGRGDRIPSIPQHNLKVGIKWEPRNGLSFSADGSYISGQYLRGDEMNSLSLIDGYVVLDLFGRYELTQSLSFFCKVDNLLDSMYETFGLLGEPGEVLGEGFENPRFLAPGPPFGVWAGFEYEF